MHYQFGATALTGRRDFIKTAAIAGLAAGFPASNLAQQSSRRAPKRIPTGKARKLLFLSDSPAAYKSLLESIKSVREFDFHISSIQVDYQKPREIAKSVEGNDADILVMCLPRIASSSGHIAEVMQDLNIPVILLPPNPDLVMLEADLAAAFRIRGINALLAHSEGEAVELLKIVAAPRILQEKRALIFGRPFDSTSVPAHNLNQDYVYEHTGVRIYYRPIEDLRPLLESVDEAGARREMERWKREAAKIVEPSDKAILESCRLYMLLRSMAEREDWSAFSIDCLSFSFSPNPVLPLPCLAFSRLRDEGITAACEADVCALLSSMLLEAISGKPSYFCNVSSLDVQKSTTVLRHCVAPLKLLGPEAPGLKYNLRDYHGMGRGAVPEVEFPIGLEVTMGSFSKDLKQFLLWPGRVQPGINDTDRPSFPNIPSSKMRMFCSNRVEIKIKQADHFLQSIAGCHHVVIAGNYAKALSHEMFRMNVELIGPSDFTAPA